MVLSHDARAGLEEFQAASHLCEICFEYRLGSNGVRGPCGHWYCRSCMQEAAAACMRDSDATGIRCPQPSCRAALPPHVVQQLLTPEDLSRWDELLLHKTLSSMRDVVFCPRCNVAAVESQDWAHCSGCGFAFCSLCYQAYHPGVQCATPEQRLQVLAMRVQRCGNNDKVGLYHDVAGHVTVLAARRAAATSPAPMSNSAQSGALLLAPALTSVCSAWLFIAALDRMFELAADSGRVVAPEAGSTGREVCARAVQTMPVLRCCNREDRWLQQGRVCYVQRPHVLEV